MKTWKEIYEENGVVQPEPSKSVKDLAKTFKLAGIKKVLDFGCGTGRHTIYLAKEGFYVVGIDYSESAIAKAKELAGGLENIELIKANVSEADISEIFYEDGHFDAAICIHVIQHMKKDEREKSISILEKAVRKDGLLFLRTISRSHPYYGKGEKIEPHTFINYDMLDGKTPHHYFSRKELEGYFSNFQMLSLEHAIHPPNKEHVFSHELHEWAMLARKLN